MYNKNITLDVVQNAANAPFAFVCHANEDDDDDNVSTSGLTVMLMNEKYKTHSNTRTDIVHSAVASVRRGKYYYYSTFITQKPVA